VRIAVIGTGISGLAVAWLLNRRYDVQVFEATNRAGGHTRTVEVREGARRLALDTGFAAFNRRNSPNLSRLFDLLEVPTQASDMSLAVSCDRCRLEFSRRSLSTLFAQKANLFRPSYHRMLVDVMRFGMRAKRLLDGEAMPGQTLAEYLHNSDLGGEFARHYLIPMAAALWSAGTEVIEAFPLETLLTFLDKHGLLGLRGGLEWETVQGGSHEYVRALTRDLPGRIHTGTAVSGVSRAPEGVRIFLGNERSELFDRVVIATHADQALGLLRDRSRAEFENLAPWRYSRNEAWLHSDVAFLPKRRAARASRNYLLRDCHDATPVVSVSYYLNRLQKLETDQHYVVTLNPERPPAADLVFERTHYDHPIFTPESVATQSGLPKINGPLATFFCGAYFGYGFHEDGLNSALRVADAFGVGLP
jgi:predicted NAD/FAD-binding protein